METTYFSLLRYGVINLKGEPDSSVQCAGVKHQMYKYGVGVLYAEGLQLDGNGWLIDNNVIDAAIQKTGAESCERMLITMKDNVMELLKKTDIPVLGIKILLRPFIVTDEKVAEFCLHVILDEKFRSDVLSLKMGIS